MPDNRKLVGTDVPLEAQVGNFDMVKVPNTEQVATVQFTDQSPGFGAHLSSSLDPSRGSADDPETSFESFFKRPVQIFGGTWPINGSLDQKMSPWTLWMRNARIANRLSNFRTFRGNLKLKILINGNSFYWGMGMASYFPGGGVEPPADFNFTDITFAGDVAKASQRMHVLLDPTSSQGGEMVLPFFYNKDAFDLTADDPDLLGELWVLQINSLFHPSTSRGVDINIFAWCDDVVLGSPTQVNIGGLVAQAGEAQDEYAKGPISKPVAKFADAAGLLKNVPVIGRYAMASQMGASAIAKIANMFGYCKPRIVTDTQRVNINQALELATTDTLDTAVSLGFNAKREVTLDPMTTGCGPADELAFSTLAARPSLFIKDANWVLSAQTGTVITSFAVTPNHFLVGNRVLPQSTGVVTFMPCSMVAYPFDYWRGVMRIRVQVVSSAFHKGRLLVTWDSRQGLSPIQTQVTRNHIIDIAEDRDCTFDIGWGSPSPACVGGGIPTTSTYINGTQAGIFPLQHNGGITISVLNELVCSADTSDPVAVNVWISFPELEVFAPDADKINLMSPWTNDTYPARSGDDTYQAQAGPVDPGTISDDKETNMPMEDNPEQTMGSLPAVESAMFMHGDPIDSFRTLLKRYCLEEMHWFDFNTTAPFKYNEHRRVMYPMYRGIQPGGDITGNLTMLQYVAQCFIGWRGSRRYKFVPNGNFPVNYSVSRLPDTTYGNLVYESTELNILAAFQDESWSGTTMCNDATGRTLEVEIPCYLPTRFAETLIRFGVNTRQLGWKISMYSDGAVPVQSASIARYGAVGDDFNLFMFIGAPQMVLRPTVPPTPP